MTDGASPAEFDYDAEMRRHNVLLRAAAGIRPHELVLDVGCGAGQTTRDAARAARAVVGVDVSEAALARARARGAAERLGNVTYVCADAQTHPFPAGRFDVCVSRFGTMFFPDPVAAFTNIGHALRTGARLVLLVWQGRELNEWAVEIHRALAGDTPPAPPPTRDAFSLADPARTEDVLTSAGFTGVHFTEVHEPVYYGADAASAFAPVLGLFAGDPSTVDAQARGRLRDTLTAHDTGDGVYFDARAWLVTAQRG